MCPQTTNPKTVPGDRDEDFHTALHEILHIIGWSSSLFPFFRDSSGYARTTRYPPPHTHTDTHPHTDPPFPPPPAPPPAPPPPLPAHTHTHTHTHTGVPPPYQPMQPKVVRWRVLRSRVSRSFGGLERPLRLRTPRTNIVVQKTR